MQYSIVIPAYNEERNAARLFLSLREVMNTLDGEFEIIFVNDGSTDGTLAELKKLSPVKIISLNRNYGQSTALDAGIEAAGGDIIITLDADGQNDPRDIPKLLNKLREENLDVVAGWRKERADKPSIRLLTFIGRQLRHFLINDPIHDSGCTLRVYQSKAAKSLDLHGEMHRYTMAMLKWKGFRMGEVEVNHHKRSFGKSKYGCKKALKGFIDLIYTWFINKYYQRPLHLFGSLGVFLAGAGFLAEGVMVYQKFTRNIDLSDNAWFSLGFFLILYGVTFFIFGITLDLLIRTYLNTSPREKRYYIREIIRQ